jgi:O-methyltransferase
VWPRLSVGGIVVFDDYGFLRCEGVTKLVDEMNLTDGIKMYNLNGQAVIVKYSA